MWICGARPLPACCAAGAPPTSGFGRGARRPLVVMATTAFVLFVLFAPTTISSGGNHRAMQQYTTVALQATDMVQVDVGMADDDDHSDVQVGSSRPPDQSSSRSLTTSKDRKYALAYQEYLKKHLAKASSKSDAASTSDGRAGATSGHRAVADKTTVLAATRSRMTYGHTKGLLDIRKANEHYLKVHMEARCRDPKPRVVRVKEFYPDPSKEYLPSCTVLHHCSDDTGCCDSDTMQCVAKRQDVVELNFYKLHLSGGGMGISGADTVERLSFVNDTECECQVVDDRPRFHVRKTMCLQCPSAFTLREQPPATCACDCFDKQKSCLRFKRGREVLPETDRRCVEARRCHQPECEYGVYDGTIGRCPRKNDRRSGHHAGHHWWKFDERD